MFPEGHLTGTFAVSKTGLILSFLPVLMFGLDYEVFLVPRMREDFVRENDALSAVGVRSRSRPRRQPEHPRRHPIGP